MDILRKLAWTVLLLTGLTGASDAPRDAQPAGREELRPAWPWLLEEEEDEFEGEGWSFWPSRADR